MDSRIISNRKIKKYMNTNLLHPSMFPKKFNDSDHLEDFMCTPTQELINELRTLDGDIIILGVAGKMGVTLAGLAKKAAPHKKIIGVARFSDPEEKTKLESWGVETITCDLLNRSEVAQLPKLKNVVFMAGRKFGTGEDASLTWAMNTLVPAIVGEHFTDSRIVAFSTIHVYPWSNPLHQGVTEEVPPTAHPGEYANSVVGRERAIEYATRIYNSTGRIMRMTYAVDMRYGVMQEIASWVLQGKPIPVGTGHVNLIWQADASIQMLRTFHHCNKPATPLNIGGPESVSVRLLAQRFGELYGKKVEFVGEEANCCFVNCDKATEMYGYPKVPLWTMIRWVAEWVQSNKPTFGKPSKFEIRSGVF